MSTAFHTLLLGLLGGRSGGIGCRFPTRTKGPRCRFGGRSVARFSTSVHIFIVRLLRVFDVVVYAIVAFVIGTILPVLLVVFLVGGSFRCVVIEAWWDGKQLRLNNLVD